MCGRVEIDPSEEWRTLFEWYGLPIIYARPEKVWLPPPKRDVAPTEQLPLVIPKDGHLEALGAFWTLVPPWVDAPTELTMTREGTARLRPPARTHFNSRKDTLLRSKGWTQLLQTQRAVLPVSAFYEWSDEDYLKPGQTKLTGKFSLKDSSTMLLACIYNPITIDNKEVLTFSIITCEPNETLKSLPHHRMPSILQGEQLVKWLDPTFKNPEQLITSTPDEQITADIKPMKPKKVSTNLELGI